MIHASIVGLTTDAVSVKASANGGEGRLQVTWQHILVWSIIVALILLIVFDSNK